MSRHKQEGIFETTVVIRLNSIDLQSTVNVDHYYHRLFIYQPRSAPER